MATATMGGYPKTINGRVALTDYKGTVLGWGKVVSRSRISPGSRGSWISNERVSYRFEIDGKWYHGRGYGDGMAVALRPMKGKPRR